MWQRFHLPLQLGLWEKGCFVQLLYHKRHGWLFDGSFRTNSEMSDKCQVESFQVCRGWFTATNSMNITFWPWFEPLYDPFNETGASVIIRQCWQEQKRWSGQMCIQYSMCRHMSNALHMCVSVCVYTWVHCWVHASGMLPSCLRAPLGCLGHGLNPLWGSSTPLTLTYRCRRPWENTAEITYPQCLYCTGCYCQLRSC